MDIIWSRSHLFLEGPISLEKIEKNLRIILLSKQDAMWWSWCLDGCHTARYIHVYLPPRKLTWLAGKQAWTKMYLLLKMMVVVPGSHVSFRVFGRVLCFFKFLVLLYIVALVTVLASNLLFLRWIGLYLFSVIVTNEAPTKHVVLPVVTITWKGK